MKWRKGGLGSSPAREDVEPWLFAFWTDVVNIRLLIMRKKKSEPPQQANCISQNAQKKLEFKYFFFV